MPIYGKQNRTHGLAYENQANAFATAVQTVLRVTVEHATEVAYALALTLAWMFVFLVAIH